ncbi:MAG: B12-binding domain-containing radical SAM protein [Myxococcales bacterium]|nr:B12-binding domain-containing radical SAM protein [Myxococcales bacterium]
MKILFLQNIWREYFGVMHLGAALRAAGHQVFVRIEPTPDGVRRAVAEVRPRVVGFSFTHCEQQYALTAAAAVKRADPSIVTLAGGPHPSLHPELARRPEIDYLCRGEGEATIVELAARLERGAAADDLPNLAFGRDGALVANPVRPLLEELDELPLPWREGYYRYSFLRDNPVKYFFTGRGCPFHCSFCFNAAFANLYPNKARYVRHYGVNRVLMELHEVKAHWPMKLVRFEDDIFTLDKERLFAILDRYAREIRLPYLVYLRAGESEAVIRRLAETGCRTVLFGVETGDENRRNDLLDKRVSNRQIIETAELLRRYNLHFFTSNILALPGETWENALETVRLNQRIRVRDAWCSVFQPYAGLPVTERAIADGRLDRVDDAMVGFNTFADNALRNPDGRRIFNLHKFFYPLARWPWLEKIVLPLTRLPANRLFHYLFVVFYVYSYRQHTGVSWRRIAREGVHWFRQFLSTMGPEK